ncbi:septum formation initiator family protein [Rhodovulum sp. BSW8]|uniref:Septum formation initiator n=1 Tax=Rhodovulum visakhapatnamense TaxID=364297 RepID=A0A4R8FUB6_9RHOB|nr:MULTISPECIES: septum formation initiator family protein [Rhodovulum]RBO53561.1 septum formation initiator family protein [Rhodovulum sp. BSW8]TDX27738.1 septum formation initiator [Rhodovulum visakhapatnamense]
MTAARLRPAWGALVYIGISFSLAMYFTFAAVQGDYGLFRRIQIEADAAALEAQKAALEAELEAVSNKTRRLSDGYLDLDLLDERARSVLGLIRADEIVVR